MQLTGMSERELDRYENYCVMQGNSQANIEVKDFRKFYGQRVRVVAGRKVPKGTTGTVFYLKRQHYGSNQWLGWSTRVGIITDDGIRHYTDAENIQLAE